MDNKRRALGRGLEELFNNEPLEYEKIEEKIITETPKEAIVELNIDELRSNPYQPRKIFDQEALEELANSIKEHGVFQPIIAKKSIKGYEIIAGERRAKASRLAGKTTIPAIVKDFTDEEMMEIAVLENLQREDLSAVEEAEAYKNLIDKLELTQEELATRLGKSRTYITNMLGLLTLPKSVKDLLVTKELSMSHARVLSKMESTETIENLAEKIITEGLNVRQLENLAQGENIAKKNQIVRTKTTSNEYKYVEENLSDFLGTKVKFKNKQLIISFENTNDLNRILEIIKHEQ